MKVEIINFYNKLLQIHNSTPQAVGWGSIQSQELRFKILCEIGSLTDSSVLDYGCGFGDLYQFLKKYKIRGYVGFDMNQKMIQRAMKKYPEAVFRTYLEMEQFDWILSSGIFNLKEKNWKRETYRTLAGMWGMCKKGMAVNFLTSFSSFKDKKCHYTNPLEMIQFITGLTKKFTLRNDYKENDFTLYLYK